MDRYGGWVKRSSNCDNSGKRGKSPSQYRSGSQGSIGRSSRRNMAKRKLFT